MAAAPTAEFKKYTRCKECANGSPTEDGMILCKIHGKQHPTNACTERKARE